MPLWSVQERDGHHILKVAETAVETFVLQTERDRNVTFTVHATPQNNRLIGYTTVVRPASNLRPNIVVGSNYMGVFYSRLQDLRSREGRGLQVLYHDQYVRLLGFGDRLASRDYLLVLRSRGN